MDSVSQPLPAELPLTDGPPQWRSPSLATRWLTSWKLWTLALILAVVTIGMAVSWRAIRRHQALEYLDDKRGAYELTADSEWITEWFGDWAKPFRDVDSIDLYVVTDESFSHISAFPELKNLRSNRLRDILERDNEFESISDRGLDSILQLSHLEEVDFAFGGMSDEQLARLFSSQQSLRCVTLHGMKATRRTLAALAKIPTLTELHIRMFSNPEDEEFRDLAPMPQLRILTLAYVESQKATWLYQATDLQSLELQYSTLTPEVLQGIANLKELETLSLAYCDISDTGSLNCLAALPRLKSLSLPRESVTWETLDTLRRMPKLERLTLDRGIDDPELDKIVRREWRCSSLYTGCF